jgi:hypothetical protein
MRENIAEDESKPSVSIESVAGAVARVYWMILGNSALYMTALAITQRAPPATWAVDTLFWATVASLVLVRYVDVRVLGGLTASGRRASLRDWHRYSRTLFLLSLALWIASQAVARAKIW